MAPEEDDTRSDQSCCMAASGGWGHPFNLGIGPQPFPLFSLHGFVTFRRLGVLCTIDTSKSVLVLRVELFG